MRRLHRLMPAALVGAIFTAGALPVLAQGPSDDSTEELVERERIRSGVEAAFDSYLKPHGSGGGRVDASIAAIEHLVALGPATVPYLVNELDQEQPDTFDFCAYALGNLKTPESEAALRDAIVRADASFGSQAISRKAWAAWGLALQGHADAVDLLDEGNHKAASYPLFSQTSMLEVAAFITLPESLPLLLSQLERYAKDEELSAERRWTIRALRRAGSPEAVAKLGPIVRNDPDMTMRNVAAYALGSIETPESVAVLLDALGDESPLVRRSTAIALDRMQAEVAVPKLFTFLDGETSDDVRGPIYRMIARNGSSKDLDKLLTYWERTGRRDRRMFVEAVNQFDGKKVLDFLGGALTGPHTAAGLEAVSALAERGSAAATAELAQGLPKVSWVVAQKTAQMAAKRGLQPLAAPITSRLLEAVAVDEGANRVSGLRVAADSMATAIVEMDHTAAIEALEAARKETQDQQLAAILDPTLDRLRLIRTHGDELAGWKSLLGHSDADDRKLALRQIARIGGAQAVATLVGAFDTADAVDQVEILRLLGEVDDPSGRALLRRVLLDPAFDPSIELRQRNMAAWSARRIGGPEMFALLSEAVERRNGRDVKVLAYAAVLGGVEALPLLEKFRQKRMRYIWDSRGSEQDKLDWIMRSLRKGRSIERYDAPPPEISFK